MYSYIEKTFIFLSFVNGYMENLTHNKIPILIYKYYIIRRNKLKKLQFFYSHSKYIQKHI